MVPRLNANSARLNVKSAKKVLLPLSRFLDLYIMANMKGETWVTYHVSGSNIYNVNRGEGS